jgi:hypothetical protein
VRADVEDVRYVRLSSVSNRQGLACVAPCDGTARLTYGCGRPMWRTSEAAGRDDRMNSHGMAVPTGSRVTGCPDPETLAAFVDGRLDVDARARVEAHVADCEDCLFIVSESVRFRDADAGAAPAASRSAEGAQQGWSRRRWLAAGGTLAAAAALVLAVRVGWDVLGSPDFASQVDALYGTIGERRPTTARLVGLQYGPPPSVKRSAARSAFDTVPLDVLAAAAQIEERAASSSTADAQHALGVARLVSGDLDGAVAALEAASAAGGRDARLAADLSAAYLTRAERTGSTEDARRGLEAANRALAIDGRLPEALFNRAFAFELLGASEDARRALDAYAQVDGDSPWVRERRARLAP